MPNDVTNSGTEVVIRSEGNQGIEVQVLKSYGVGIMPRGRPPKTTVQRTPPPPESPQEEVLSGLYLFGTVIDRTRRTINTRGNTTAEIVTYTIQDADGRRYYVDEYSPEEYYELSEYAEVPVYVKTFKKRTGDICYSFCVQAQGGPTRGEHF